MFDSIPEEIQQYRKSDYSIHPLILCRWSPRSMSEKEMSHEELLCLFEAARWAPSSYNNQPWRFLYAKRNTAHWDKFFNLMVPFNQSWAKNAACLVVIISKKTFDHNGKPCDTHSFDTGAAWMSLALEGTHKGYVVHGMQGFDYAKAKTVLNIPDDYQVEAMVAIGKPDSRERLPKDMQDNEVPSGRRPLSEIILEGGF